jgi:hypothetical protein
VGALELSLLHLQPELDQAADGFGAGQLRFFLLGNPCVQGLERAIQHADAHDGPRTRRNGTPSLIRVNAN